MGVCVYMKDVLSTCMSGVCEHVWCVSTHDRCTCGAHALDWGGRERMRTAGLASFTQVCSRQMLIPKGWQAKESPNLSYHAYSLV